MKTLATSPEALAVGQKLFLNNCAQCHASDGGGIARLPQPDRPRLALGRRPDDDQGHDHRRPHRRDAAVRRRARRAGREGRRALRDVAFRRAERPLRVARGKPLFKQTCVACHGADGKGNPALGAPNLTDRIWLHGSGEPAIIETITRGRSNQMPAHKDLLSEAKIHLLTGLRLSLSSQACAGEVRRA